MLLSQELYNEKIYSATVVPPFKRLQYYFIITFEDGSRRVLLEDGIHEMSVIERHDLARHFFKFGWMNESDICRTPQWVENTVWYQIFLTVSAEWMTGIRAVSDSGMNRWSQGITPFTAVISRGSRVNLNIFPHWVLPEFILPRFSRAERITGMIHPITRR